MGLALNERDASPNFVTILSRAFSLLDCMLYANHPMGISELSKAAQIPKANVFRIMKTLEYLNVVALEDGNYVFGSKMIEYSNAAKKNNEFLSAAIPSLRTLSAQCHESVNLGVPFKGDILILHTETGEQSALVSFLPPLAPMYCSSIGKLFLAAMEDSALTRYFRETACHQRTVNTIVSEEQFLNEKKEILKTGISYDREEYDYGLVCMSAPIYGKGGEIAAGISISGPGSRLKFKGYENLETLLKQTAEEVSQLLRSGMVNPPILS